MVISPTSRVDKKAAYTNVSQMAIIWKTVSRMAEISSGTIKYATTTTTELKTRTPRTGEKKMIHVSDIVMGCLYLEKN